MIKIDNISEELNSLHVKIQQTIRKIKEATLQENNSLDKGIDILRTIRFESYENINQFQHANLILKTALYLNKEYGDLEWFWHPFQTGGTEEPDLRGLKNDKIIVSVEVTTSEKPQGVIDKRMKKTLEKLNAMEGSLYYVIRTDAMERRAKTKVQKINPKITILKI